MGPGAYFATGIVHASKSCIGTQTGLWLCTKRLERGRFSWPAAAATGEGKVVLSQEDLALLLGGIELKQTRRKAWYGRRAEKVNQAA